MVIKQNQKREAGNSPLSSRPHVVKISSVIKGTNDAVDEPSLLFGRKLRNRIIFVNALVWIGIVVAIRLMFF